MKYLKNCNSCNSNRNIKRISPTDPVYNGKYWLVEHAYPSGMLGWLVLLPKRHIEAMHKLTPKEYKEFGKIFPKIIKALHKETNCEKEYIFQMAKATGFKHIHFHIAPKAKRLSKRYEGIKIFDIKNKAKPLNKNKIIEFCNKLRKRLDKI